MKAIRPNLHWLWAGLVVAVVLGMALRPTQQQGRVDLRELSTTPVVSDGRVKPVDTAARTVLRVISGVDNVTVGKNDERTALEWFLEVLSADDLRSSPVWKYKVFRITNDQVLSLLGLTPREGFRYSLDEFDGKSEKLREEGERASDLQTKGHELDLFEREALRLYQNYEGFWNVRRLRQPLLIPPQGDADWNSLSRRFGDILGNMPDDAANTAKLEILASICLRRKLKPDDLQNLSRKDKQSLIEEVEEELEKRCGDSFVRTTPRNGFDASIIKGVEAIPAAKAWRDLLIAYRNSDKAAFAQAVQDYRATETKVEPIEFAKSNVEEWYNRISIFYWCTGLYIIAALLICASWLGWSAPLRRTADSIIVLTFIVHFIGLCVRMYLQGRPPVTNLYSSAIFIGLGCVYLGLILERLWPIGVGNLIGSTMGFLTAIIAHNLGSDRDTLENLQAVLDTNFWLSTHVTMVTTGYTATFVTGFIGMIFIIRGVFTRSLDAKTFKTLGQMLYGVLCFAMFASFTGTVLGGIWADQSWGRFWGWDSKENGAVLVVLWNAIILHARWAGLIKQRGTAVMAVAGNIVVAWSWFGTNMLGVGLHSYGFMDKAVPYLVGFWISQFILIGVGAIPTKYWRSFGVRPPSGPKEPAEPPTQRAPRQLVAAS